jgi:DNA-binding NarL/FixJ family response regulator
VQAALQPPSRPDEPSATHKVTLVTGDVVTVRIMADGPRRCLPDGAAHSAELDRKIVALLLAGLSDQAISTQLDLSQRTLQRRLRHLMDVAGVRTRIQLGWYAARSGSVESA